MKINPNDPWRPVITSGDTKDEIFCPGVTIRLKLAVEMMNSPILFGVCDPEDEPTTNEIMDRALFLADAMIERANRDEGSETEHRNDCNNEEQSYPKGFRPYPSTLDGRQ